MDQLTDQQLADRIAEALTREDVNWGYHCGFEADTGSDMTAAYVAAVTAVVQLELDRLTTALEVATTQHAKAIAARDKARQHAKISDGIAAAERELFQTAIRDLGGEPVQVQTLYAQLTLRARQWKAAQAEADSLRAELATARDVLTAGVPIAEAAQEASVVLAAVSVLADRWDNALAVDKPYARALRAALNPPAPAAGSAG